MNAPEKPAAGAEIDGYRLLRPIGQGGFGTVWLCWSEASQSYHALKWVPGEAGGLQHELRALRNFREVSQRLRSPSLIAIEHINLLRAGLIYTLPLADGMEGNDPSAETWRPMTLDARIEGQRASPGWLSSSEILQIILPIIKATALLNDEGLVHRDIKPANILFFGGRPCLADIGLLADDSASLTQRGTPGFLAPSWFLESSGQPDMWGLATTLYTLLTGNNPDKMGRPNFLWPPAGKDSLTSAEHNEWQRLHAVIYRATHEQPAERFRDFQTFEAAVENTDIPGAGHRKKSGKLVGFRVTVVAGAVLILVGASAWIYLGIKQHPSPTLDESDLTSARRPSTDPITPSPTPDSTTTHAAPPATPEQGMSATRQQEFDNAATAITRKLEKRKAEIPGNIFRFQELVAEISGKMRAFNSGKSHFSDVAEKMQNFAPASFGEGDGAGDKELALAKLLAIKNSLIKLLEIVPSRSEAAEIQNVNSMYESLANSAYAMAATPDERFYFANQIRPRLDRDFQRIFKTKPGNSSRDLIVDLQMALAILKLSDPDAQLLSDIEASVNQINAGQ